ncbi:MAG: hypothetical protein ACT6XY_08185 [Phreatobacter sp.]|uniref:hypothetical protein n=1 Tax=Phreatobacter sp. TaxID=1966341 RepID=UPI004036A69C
MSILTSTPLWVWPLFALLVFVGLTSRRERSLPMAVVFLLPAIGLVTLPTLAAMPHPGVALAAYGLAYAAGAATGYRLQGRWVLAKGDGRARLAGESLTLAGMMTLFSAKFVHGAMAAMAPAAVSGITYVATFAAVTGVAAGLFGGRALRTIMAPATA